MSPDLTATFAVEPVTTTAGLGALEDDWLELWQRCPSATPFQHPAWLLPWWRHVGEGDLLALAFRESGRLVGLAPLYLYRSPQPPSREVLLLGSGTSDHLDLLAAPGSEEAVARQTLAWLAAESERWDAIDLQMLPAASPLLRVASPPGLHGQPSLQDHCPVLPLPEREADLASVIPRRLLDNLAYSRRRAEREHDARFERATGDNLEELLEALLALHAARWRTRGEGGVLAAPAVAAMQREAVPRLHAAGLLRMHALRLDGRIFAINYCLVSGERMSYYIGGFDPMYEKLSPGSLVILEAIREAVHEGRRLFDFLRGREDYKYRWGAHDEPVVKLRLVAG